MSEESKSLNKKLFGLFLVFAFIMIGMMYYLYSKDYKKNLSYSFNGNVEHIKYDDKGFPYVTVNKKTYYLSYNNWDFNHCIEQNDSIQKFENMLIIMVKKHHSGQTLIFGK